MKDLTLCQKRSTRTSKACYCAFKTTYCVMFIAVCFVFGLIFYYSSILPDNVTVYNEQDVAELNFNTAFAISNVENGELDKASGQVGSAKRSRRHDLRVMGVIPIKTITVNRIETRYVALGGQNFGIKIFTRGVMVVGMTDINSASGRVNPAKMAGLQIGDIILAVNGEELTSNNQLSRLIRDTSDNVILTVKREEQKRHKRLTPAFCIDAEVYKAGVWVRDSTAGLGTKTFYSPVSGAFAGLGHGIMDVDTGLLLPINSGEAVRTNITSINRSRRGTTGEINGVFTDERIGSLTINSQLGVYGFLDEFGGRNLVKVAPKQSVRTGQAQILTTLDNGEPRFFYCVIERIDMDNETGQNLLIRITDRRLIGKTGGIVQGMSGSPIIQNDMIVGALTNVFVNDPRRGYAIFAEEMYQKTLYNIRVNGQ